MRIIAIGIIIQAHGVVIIVVKFIITFIKAINHNHMSRSPWFTD